MEIVYMVSSGMKFRNKKKFRYGIPVYNDTLQALINFQLPVTFVAGIGIAK
jgi:hypothetical protein